MAEAYGGDSLVGSAPGSGLPACRRLGLLGGDIGVARRGNAGASASVSAKSVSGTETQSFMTVPYAS